MTEHITDENFEEKVLKADKPVLVDFWAEWCGPCRQMGPVVDEVATELEGQAYVYKLNIDEHPVAARQYRITSIPNFCYFNGGELVNQVIGGRPKKSLIEPLKPYLG